MYRKNELKINIFYDDSQNILNVLELDFKEFFNDYIKKHILIR